MDKWIADEPVEAQEAKEASFAWDDTSCYL